MVQTNLLLARSRYRWQSSSEEKQRCLFGDWSSLVAVLLRDGMGWDGMGWDGIDAVGRGVMKLVGY